MVLRKFKTALTNPMLAAYALWAKLEPRSLLNRYETLALKRAGLDRLYMVMSLDCDTTDDIRVAWDLNSRLLDMGIKPVYAVPGELLQEGEKVYRRIAETGAEFLNHGYTKHARFDETRGC